MKIILDEVAITAKGVKAKGVYVDTEEKEPSQVPSGNDKGQGKAFIKNIITKIIKWVVNPCNK